MHKKLPAREVRRRTNLEGLLMESNEIARIKSLANKRNYSEALYECNALLQSGKIGSADILRARAYVYSRSGDFDSAINDYRAILESADAELRDWYLAADNALEAERYSDAAKWFSGVVRLSDLQGESWFHSAALFYLAYCWLMIGNSEDALNSLSLSSSMDPGIELYLPRLGMCSVQKLRGEILKQARLG